MTYLSQRQLSTFIMLLRKLLFLMVSGIAIGESMRIWKGREFSGGMTKGMKYFLYVIEFVGLLILCLVLYLQ